MAFPKLLDDLVNSGTDASFGLSLSQTAILIAIMLVLQASFFYLRTGLFVNVIEKSLATLRLVSYSHLIKLLLQFFDKESVGELNSRISSDVVLFQ